MTQSPEAPIEALLRDELAHGDLVLGTIGPVLGHLLANHDHSLFSDEIVTRVRAMAGSLARDMLVAQAEASGMVDPRGFAAAGEDDLASALLADERIAGHCHALAVEWQLTTRLEARNAIDPVLSPLLQALVASDDTSTAATAMAALAAQARFLQRQRRMELPLAELPADLFHAALTRWAGRPDPDALTIETAAGRLRERYDEGASRLGLLARLAHGMGVGLLAALNIGHAGPALFLSALAVAAQFDRDLAVIATNDRQLARLALALRAAGIKPKAIEEQFAYFHPDVALPQGFDELRADRAAALLAASPRSAAA